MKYIVAVSGGVDSVVLLDMLTKNIIPIPELIVAHFDHGIRKNSQLDAEFVCDLAKKYGLDFETERVELGQNASEELARKKRYEFLNKVAEKHGAKIITAHHMDDVIETIAINLTRGTGWRGLAAMDSEIIRPLTNMSKIEIIEYAKKNNLSWREDVTNESDKYLRNRLRAKLRDLDYDKKMQLLALWAEQKNLKRQIDEIITTNVEKSEKYNRDMFDNLDESVALEILRYITDAELTRPQMKKALSAIKEFLPSKICQAGNHIELKFTSRNFIVKLIK